MLLTLTLPTYTGVFILVLLVLKSKVLSCAVTAGTFKLTLSPLLPDVALSPAVLRLTNPWMNNSHLWDGEGRQEGFWGEFPKRKNTPEASVKQLRERSQEGHPNQSGSVLLVVFSFFVSGQLWSCHPPPPKGGKKSRCFFRAVQAMVSQLQESSSLEV